MKRVLCQCCWRIIWLSCCDVNNPSLTVCFMKALLAHIHEADNCTYTHSYKCTSGLHPSAFHHWQEVTSLLIGLSMHRNFISVRLEVFMSHSCRCEIATSHFSVITMIWYMRFVACICLASTKCHTEELKKTNALQTPGSSSLLLESRQETWADQWISKDDRAGKWDKERIREGKIQIETEASKTWSKTKAVSRKCSTQLPSWPRQHPPVSLMSTHTHTALCLHSNRLVSSHPTKNLPPSKFL